MSTLVKEPKVELKLSPAELSLEIASANVLSLHGRYTASSAMLHLARLNLSKCINDFTLL